MRLVTLPDPRWIVLLVLPLLVAAAAVQEHGPPLVSSGAAAHPEPVRLLQVQPAAVDLAPAPADAGGPAVEPAQALRAVPPTQQGASRRTGRRTVQERGEAALASLDYDWRRLGYRVQFRPYDGTSLGSANRVTRTITVYVKPQQSELSLRTSLAHELGHALDFEHGDADRRATYRRVRGLSPSSAWWPCNRCNDYSSPAGDFAEVFAAWLVGPGDFRGRLKGPPSAGELQELTPLFRIPAVTTPPAESGDQPAPEPSPREEQESTLPPLPDRPGGARG